VKDGGPAEKRISLHAKPSARKHHIPRNKKRGKNLECQYEIQPLKLTPPLKKWVKKKKNGRKKKMKTGRSSYTI